MRAPHRTGPPAPIRRTVAALLVGVVALGGCGGDEQPPDDVTPTAAPTSSDDATATEEPTTATESPTTSDGTPTSEEPTPTAAPAPTTSPSPSPTPTTSPSPSPTPPAPPPPPPAPPVDDLVAEWAGLDIEAFDTSRAVVALTFDGGASNTAVSSILATLASEGVPATFFVTGDFARAYPSSVRAMDAAGHPVGNHSNTHPSFPDSTNEEIRAQLAAADAAISALTGEHTAPLFRFPFGDRTPLDIQVVNAAGYIPIRWTVDTLGWKGTEEGITTAIVRQRILDTLRPGQVVLMHVGAHPEDGSTLDADALPGIIDDLQARGYGFTTLPELLAEGR